MKRLFFLWVLFSFFACSSDKSENNQKTSITGKWQLIEEYGSIAGEEPQWVSVENSYFYTFTKDDNFTSNRFSECQTGNFSLTNTQLILDFGCAGFTAGIETPEGTFIENYSLENGFLYLSPNYLTCDEGCSYKFEKINE